MIGNILIYLAGIVIALHTIFPHQHHDEISSDDHEIQHQEANSLLDYIKLIFHEDMGEGHLEHVVVAHSLNLDNQLDFQIQHTIYHEFDGLLKDKTYLQQTSEDEFLFEEISPQPFHFDTNALRGPPSWI